MRKYLPKLYAADAFVVGLAVLPAAVSIPSLAATAPGDTQAWLRVAGQLAGVLGLGWLLLAGFLAIRIPGMDQPLGGLIRVWRIHHLIGTGAFLLLLSHPLLLALASATDGPSAAVSTLFPPLSYVSAWAGWVALLAMMVFLAPTYAFFGKPAYQRWKWLHMMSGIAVALGLAHGLALARSPGGASAWALWGGFGILGLSAYAWRGLLVRFARRTYRITSVQSLAPRVVELALKPESGAAPRYQPGQFVYLTPEDPSLDAGRGEEHPYTLSSAPDESELRIAIKDLGDASHALQSVTPGSRAHVEGPYGRFFPKVHREAELWIGGGIGVTPFVSRMRALDGTSEPLDIHFLYCAHDAKRAYFLQELQDIAQNLTGLSITPHYFVLHGPLTQAFVEEHVDALATRTAYICGPKPLLDIATRLLREAGVSRARIHTEEFELL